MSEKFLEKKYKALEKPPIEEGVVFNPEEEVKDIRWVVKEDQRKELANFKEKLAYQKEGLARMQEILTAEIRKNPDIKFEELRRLVEEYGKKYGFTDEQKEITDEILRKYIEKHNLVKEIREKYPNDKELFKVLFLKEPKGEIEVVKGPMTLAFRCYDKNDFVYLYAGKWGKDELDDEDGRIYDKRRGFSITSMPLSLKKLSNFIIALNNCGADNAREISTTLLHEEQHAIDYGLFNEQAYEASFDEFENDLKKSNNYDEILAAIRRYFNNAATIKEIYVVKRELLSFFKEGHNKASIINWIINDLYKGFYKKYKNEAIHNAIKLLGDEYIKIIKKIANEVFKKEYERLIEECIDAFDLLRKNGFSLEKSIAILEQEPIRKWKKTVDRIIEARKSREDKIKMKSVIAKLLEKG